MRTLLTLLLLAWSAFGQATPSVPDFAQTFTFTANGQNSTPVWVGPGAGAQGTVAIRLTYSVDGVSFTAASITLQGATAAASTGCAAASYATITAGGSTVVEAVNPSASAAQGNIGVKTFYPCIRAHVASVTGAGGTIKGSIYGFKNLFVFPSGGATDVNIADVGGVAVTSCDPSHGCLPVGGTDTVGQNPTQAPTQIAGQASDGSIARVPVCTDYRAITATASGSTEIIAAVASATVEICEVVVQSDTVMNIKLVRGTGSNCVTSPTDMTGFFYQTLGFALDPNIAMNTAASQAVCINLSTTGNVGGYVSLRQFNHSTIH